MILVTVTTPGSYQLMRYLATQLKVRGKGGLILYMGSRDERYHKIVTDAQPVGIEVASFGSYVESCHKGHHLPIGMTRKLLLQVAGRACKRSDLYKIFLRHFSIELAAAQKLLAQFNPSAIIVAEDGISGPLSLLSQARADGVKCVTVPYANGRASDLELDQDRKRAAGEQIVPSGRDRIYLKALADQWIKRGAHAGATMFDPAYILALETLGLTLRAPWICYGGPSRIICADSKDGRDQLLREGIEPQTVKLTGSPYCDEMLESLARDGRAMTMFMKPNYIDSARPRVLINWPPDYHSTHVNKNEFSSYVEMTDTYFSYFKSLVGCDVTISMHPDAGKPGEDALARNELASAREHLVGLIPLNDIFVTFFSSATRWAVAAGKPVLNINLYAQDIDNYKHLPGVVHTDNFAAFSVALHRMTTDATYFAGLAADQAQVADAYGNIDGKCVDRILYEVDALG